MMTIVDMGDCGLGTKKNDPKDLGSFSRQSEVRKSMAENLITLSRETLDSWGVLTIGEVNNRAVGVYFETETSKKS